MLKKNKLESELDSILNNMSYEDILKYYNGLNRKFINSYPSISSINGNAEEFNNLYDVIEKVNKILIKRYNFIELVDFTNKFEILNNKYIEEVNEGNFYYYLRYYIHLKAIVDSLTKDLTYLKEHLIRFFLLYYFRKDNLEEVLIEIGVPEDSTILECLEPYIYEDNFSFYGRSLEQTFNNFIESIVNNIEYSIAEAKHYRKIKVSKEKAVNLWPEKIVLLINGLNSLVELRDSLIADYMAIKEEPYKDVLEALVEVHINLLKEADLLKEDSAEEVRTNLKEQLPTYDFKEFKLITD